MLVFFVGEPKVKLFVIGSTFSPACCATEGRATGCWGVRSQGFNRLHLGLTNAILSVFTYIVPDRKL